MESEIRGYKKEKSQIDLMRQTFCYLHYNKINYGAASHLFYFIFTTLINQNEPFVIKKLYCIIVCWLNMSIEVAIFLVYNDRQKTYYLHPLSISSESYILIIKWWAERDLIRFWYLTLLVR